MLKLIVMAALLALAGPAFADGIARQGADWVRITALPCTSEAVLGVIQAAGDNAKDYRAASAEFQGHQFNACAKPIWEKNLLWLRYEDGDQGLIPFDEVKPVPEASLRNVPGVELALRREVSPLRQLLVVEDADVLAPRVPTAAHPDVHDESPFPRVYAHASGRAVGTSATTVLHVDRGSGVPKVGDAVVRLDLVPVVDVTHRPAAVNVQPSEALRAVRPAIDLDVDVALPVHTTSHSADGAARATLDEVHENARLGIVVQELAQSGDGEAGSGHKAFPS